MLSPYARGKIFALRRWSPTLALLFGGVALAAITIAGPRALLGASWTSAGRVTRATTVEAAGARPVKAAAATTTMVGSAATTAAPGDYLLGQVNVPSVVEVNAGVLSMGNGIVARSFQLAPGVTTTSIKNLHTGSELLSSTGEAEALVTLNGNIYKVGGTNAPADFVMSGYVIQASTQKPYEWTPNKADGSVKPWSQPKNWPAAGKAVVFTYVPGSGVPAALAQTTVNIRYEIYDGIPVMMKKLTVVNTSATEARLDGLTLDTLNVSAAQKSRLYIDTDFHGDVANVWRNNDKDRTYNQTDTATGRTYTILYKQGPAYRIGANVPTWGTTFESFRSFLLPLSSDYYETQMMEVKRMYATVAPQVADNPLFYHLISDDMTAMANSAQTASGMGFEAVIQSFGSGFDMTSGSASYISAHAGTYSAIKGLGMLPGGYTLFTTGQIFNPTVSSCAGTAWGTVMSPASTGMDLYQSLMSQTLSGAGAGIIEIDGAWPLFQCNETNLAYAHGGADTVHKQWVINSAMYKNLRAKDIYINTPDWHYLNGANKNGIGYQEDAWSSPRQQQLLFGRQYIYTGTYEKLPSMGWTFIPVAQYHGGGAAATFSPLKQNLFDYSWAVGQDLLAGVNPTFRGTSLDEGDPDVNAVVKYWVSVFKTYRSLTKADIVHIAPPVMSAAINSRATGIDAFMHVQALGNERALVAVFNQTDQAVSQTLTLPLYHTGLTNLSSAPQPVPGSYMATSSILSYGSWPVQEYFPPAPWSGSYPAATATANSADIYQEGAGPKLNLVIDSNGNATLPINLAPMSFTWFIVTPQGATPVAAPVKPTALVNLLNNQPLRGKAFGSGNWTTFANSDFHSALDGDPNTFFDGNTSTGNAGLDLGVATVVRSVRIYPRQGQAGRVVGTRIQGSNDGVNYLDLLTINYAPTTASADFALSNSQAFRYYRYYGGTDYTNVAEVQFFTQPVPALTTTVDKVVGTAFGTGNWTTFANSDFNAPFDGDPNTFFDGNSATGYAGLDLGSAKVIRRIHYTPRASQPGRMLNARIQGSNTSATSGFTDLYTITQVPSVKSHEAAMNNSTAYRWYRYYGGTDYTNVAEVEFDESNFGLYKAKGTLFGSADWGGWPFATGYAQLFDGDTSTFFDGSSPTGYAGMDLGASRVLRRVRLYPRPSQPRRLVNLQIQGSNTSPTAGFVTLYTVANELPVAWNTISVSNSTAYRYYRVYGGTDYTNVAEAEFWVEPVNIAGGMAVMATSTATGSAAGNVNDGNLSTSWTSAAEGNQSVTLDLGATTNVDSVRIVWGASYAINYIVQTSTDGVDWTNQRLMFGDGSGEAETSDFPRTAQARFVRISASVSSTGLNYSIAELQVLQK